MPRVCHGQSVTALPCQYIFAILVEHGINVTRLEILKEEMMKIVDVVKKLSVTNEQCDKDYLLTLGHKCTMPSFIKSLEKLSLQLWPTRWTIS